MYKIFKRNQWNKKIRRPQWNRREWDRRIQKRNELPSYGIRSNKIEELIKTIRIKRKPHSPYYSRGKRLLRLELNAPERNGPYGMAVWAGWSSTSHLLQYCRLSFYGLHSALLAKSIWLTERCSAKTIWDIANHTHFIPFEYTRFQSMPIPSLWCDLPFVVHTFLVGQCSSAYSPASPPSPHHPAQPTIPLYHYASLWSKPSNEYNK